MVFWVFVAEALKAVTPRARWLLWDFNVFDEIGNVDRASVHGGGCADLFLAVAKPRQRPADGTTDAKAFHRFPWPLYGLVFR